MAVGTVTVGTDTVGTETVGSEVGVAALEGAAAKSSASHMASVLAAYPRVDFKKGIVQAFADGFGYRPETTFGTMNTDILEGTQPDYRRPNFCDLIAANPLGG